MDGVDEVCACAIAKPPLPEGDSAIEVVTLILEMDGIACVDWDGVITGEDCYRMEDIYLDIINQSYRIHYRSAGACVGGY